MQGLWLLRKLSSYTIRTKMGAGTTPRKSRAATSTEMVREETVETRNAIFLVPCIGAYRACTSGRENSYINTHS